MKRRIVIIILCFALLLTGCSGILEREYRSVSRHVSQTSDPEDTSALRVETYSELVNSVQYFALSGAEVGTVHLYQYSGDVEQDLKDAAQEVLTRDPLGSWALSDIQYTTSKIVSYYECVFTFTYRRSPEEIKDVQTLVGSSSIRQALQESLCNFDTTFLLETNSYYADKELFLSLIQEAYYASPGYAMGYPGVTIDIYPEDPTASWHIVEFTFTYSKSQAVLQQQAQQVNTAAATLTGMASGEGAVGSWLLYSRLADQMEYAPNGEPTVYAALISGPADSQGAALAYHLLCSQTGIECTTVQGTLDGSTHWWNMVRVDGLWHHVDVTAGDTQESFFHSDSQMTERYTWDETSYPVCPDVEPEEETEALPEEETEALPETISEVQ